ncbi:MAG: ABC transporter permease [Tissierellales bacterium]
MGLREPLHKQLGSFYKALLIGNLGTSIIYRPKVAVTEILKTKIPYSLYFGLAAMIISLFFGVSLGIVMALSKSKIWDKLGTASYAMWMRRYMVDEINKDYVKSARAKGLKDKRIMVKHVLRNSFVPMSQYLPTSLLFTISGSGKTTIGRE